MTKCQPESLSVSGEMSNVTIQSFVLIERTVAHRFRINRKMNPSVQSSSQLSGDNLLRSVENLINICENASADLSRHRDKLNMILNDLNSIDFKYVQTLDIIKVSLETHEHLLDLTCISIEFRLEIRNFSAPKILYEY